MYAVTFRSSGCGLADGTEGSRYIRRLLRLCLNAARAQICTGEKRNSQDRDKDHNRFQKIAHQGSSIQN